MIRLPGHWSLWCSAVPSLPRRFSGRVPRCEPVLCTLRVSHRGDKSSEGGGGRVFRSGLLPEADRPHLSCPDSDDPHLVLFCSYFFSGLSRGCEERGLLRAHRLEQRVPDPKEHVLLCEDVGSLALYPPLVHGSGAAVLSDLPVLSPSCSKGQEEQIPCHCGPSDPCRDLCCPRGGDLQSPEGSDRDLLRDTDQMLCAFSRGRSGALGAGEAAFQAP